MNTETNSPQSKFDIVCYILAYPMIVISFLLWDIARSSRSFDTLHDGAGPSMWELSNYGFGRTVSILQICFSTVAIIICKVGIGFFSKNYKSRVIKVFMTIGVVMASLLLILGVIELKYFIEQINITKQGLDFNYGNVSGY